MVKMANFILWCFLTTILNFLNILKVSCVWIYEFLKHILSEMSGACIEDII